MLSPTEIAAAQRGADWKRVLRAAAALNGIYNDSDLADAVGVTAGAVRGWWGGATPKADTIDDMARSVRLTREELFTWINYGGPAPRLQPPVEVEAQARAAAAERSVRVPRATGGSEEPPSPRKKAGSAG